MQYMVQFPTSLHMKHILNSQFILCTFSSDSCDCVCRSIMSDIQRDNRVVSLSCRAGIRNSLVTILDQLQRCQKSLNEFLEVH